MKPGPANRIVSVFVINFIHRGREPARALILLKQKLLLLMLETQPRNRNAHNFYGRLFALSIYSPRNFKNVFAVIDKLSDFPLFGKTHPLSFSPLVRGR